MKNIRVNSKHAQSHIEIITSFVVFIGFLLFVFILFNPFAKTTEPSYLMDNAQTVLLKNISGEFGELSIFTNGGGCYNFDASYGSYYFEVKNAENKYTIYFNEIFNPPSALKKGCAPLDYSLGTYSNETIVIEERIKELKQIYESESYNTLKDTLGISDFSFSIIKLNTVTPIPELSVERDRAKTIEAKARDIPIRMINSTGTITENILRIRVWE